MYAQKAGHLSVGTTRSGGKVVDEWTFVSPFKDTSSPKLVVQVSIDKTKNDRILFCAHADCLGQNIEDTDIEQLRQKVEAALRFQHDMRTGVVWEDWIEVEVRGETEKSARSGTHTSDLRIRARRLQRGVDPTTGNVFVINYNNVVVPFPKPKKAGELDEGEVRHEIKGLNLRDAESEYSYLPATAANVAALEELMGRLTTLRARLAEFLRQDVVHASLANLASGFPALSAPLS